MLQEVLLGQHNWFYISKQDIE